MDKNTIPHIDNGKVLPQAQDYQYLLNQGLEKIASYSSASWTNYNDSDPGITILQSLVYGLTELGYKADFPIEDVLTNKEGKIDFKDHLSPPVSVLPVNPVTFEDFQKLLLSAIPEIKQVYFLLMEVATVEVIRVSAEIQPACALKYNSSSFSRNIRRKLDTMLARHGNIGQLFLDSDLLEPVPLDLLGDVAIEPGTDPNKYMAELIYHLNDFVSPFPHFLSYQELISLGKSPDEILQGPMMSNGFIPEDDLLETKRKGISIHELTTAVLKIPSTVQVSSLQFGSGESIYPISIDQSIIFDYNGIKKINIRQNGNIINNFNKRKIAFYLKKLIPQYVKSQDFAFGLPKGKYRDLKAYSSFQQELPPLYNMTIRHSSLTQLGKQKRGPIKQLKAYLSIFDQLNANFLAQLSHVSDLFSYRSGKDVYHLAERTYNYQPIYGVSGVAEVLKGVRNAVYRFTNKAGFMAHWKSYKKDPFNPYIELLRKSQENTETNLDRKTRVLNHLMARFGGKWSPDALQFTNPNYGNMKTAEVRFLSESLRLFPMLSSNSIRTYFKLKSEDGLFSGIERNVSHELWLRDYYLGIIETARDKLDNGSIIINAIDQKGDRKTLFGAEEGLSKKISSLHAVEVLQNGEKLFWWKVGEKTVPQRISLMEARTWLSNKVEVLTKLTTYLKGFVLIDMTKVLRSLEFSILLSQSDGRKVYSVGMNLNDLTKVTRLFEKKASLKVLKTKAQYGLGIATQPGRVKILVDNLEESGVQRLKNVLEKRVSTGNFEPPVCISNADFPVDSRTFELSVNTYFPAWPSIHQDENFRQFVLQRMMEACPINSACKVRYLSADQMDGLITKYLNWRNYLQKSYDGNSDKERERKAAIALLNFIQTRISHD